MHAQKLSSPTIQQVSQSFEDLTGSFAMTSSDIVEHLGWLSGWPLVGNEGMKFYAVMMGIDSLIPYFSGQPAMLDWFQWFRFQFQFGG